jgi:3-oxoacyl-[acyl-carrier protein] reductase
LKSISQPFLFIDVLRIDLLEFGIIFPRRPANRAYFRATMRLKDKKAIVTGAGQGIGRAIAIKMAVEGADVVIADRNPETAGRVAKELEALDRKALCAIVDVVDRGTVERMLASAVETWGRIDILVNNAGFDRGGTLLKLRDEDWDAVLGVHLKGSFHCIQAVAPHMIGNRYGKIVNLSSIYGKVGGIAESLYCSAKAGIIGLTKSAARELARHEINVNAVLPGLILTPTIETMAEKYRNLIIENTPLRRIGRPEEVANVVAFLASDEASYMTGAAVEVAGGWNM